MVVGFACGAAAYRNTFLTVSGFRRFSGSVSSIVVEPSSSVAVQLLLVGGNGHNVKTQGRKSAPVHSHNT